MKTCCGYSLEVPQTVLKRSTPKRENLLSRATEMYKVSSVDLFVPSSMYTPTLAFYLAGLNKDNNFHSSDACFHILVCMCKGNFNKVLYFFSSVGRQNNFDRVATLQNVSISSKFKM